MAQKDEITDVLIFESLLSKLVNKHYKTIIQLETPHQSIFMDQHKNRDFLNILQYFPQNNQVYKDIISVLIEISEYNWCDVLHSLSDKTHDLLQGTTPSIFKSFFEITTLTKPVPRTILKYFLLYLLSNLICSILQKNGIPQKDELNTNLIHLGIKFAILYRDNVFFTTQILEQWSIIFSFISQYRPDYFFLPNKTYKYRSSQTESKIDLSCSFLDTIQSSSTSVPHAKYIKYYFMLFRFVRLDKLDTNLITTLLTELDKFLAKLPNSKDRSTVLTSLSTLLITIDLSRDINHTKELQNFLDKAHADCNQLKSDCPGAYDLAISLSVKLNKNDPKINELCQEIFKKTANSSMTSTRARVFVLFMRNFSLDADYYTWMWGNKYDDRQFLYLNEFGDKEKIKSIFLTYIKPSDFAKCPTALSAIIMILAAMDFKFFKSAFKDLFKNYRLTDPRNLTLIQTLPRLNSPVFSQVSKIQKAEIESFICDLLHRLFQEIYEPKIESDFDIMAAIKEKYINTITNATKKIEELNTHSNFDFGSEYNEVGFIKSSQTVSSKESMLYNAFIDIIPSIVTGGLSNMTALSEMFVVLSANKSDSIASPLYQSCLLLLKKSDSAMELVTRMMKIVTSQFHDAVVCNCLKLLNKALDESLKDPQQTNQDIYGNIEFTALVGLCSENPYARILSFRLLKEVNRNLQNNGLYSHIEEHRDSIESNARNNIIQQEYLKSTHDLKYRMKPFALETCLASQFQVPWLYFLAEFCRLINSTQELSGLLSPIRELAKKLSEPNQKYYISPSLHLGLLVVFAVTSTPNKELNNNDEQYMKNVIYIFKEFSHKETKSIFYALRHANAIMISNLLQNPGTNLNKLDLDPLQVIRTIASMANTLDEYYSVIEKRVELNEEEKTKLEEMTEKDYNAIKEYLDRILDTLNNQMATYKTEIANYISKKERNNRIRKNKPVIKYDSAFTSQQSKKNLNNFKIAIRKSFEIVSNFLDAIRLLSHDSVKDLVNKIIMLIYTFFNTSKKYKAFKTIKKMAAKILALLFQEFPSFSLNNINENDFLTTISVCEHYRISVLHPLLIIKNKLLPLYIDNYFVTNSTLSKAYFNAILEAMQQSETIFDDLFNQDVKLWGSIFLMALYRVKSLGLKTNELLRQIINRYIKSNHLGKTMEASPSFNEDLKNNLYKVPKKYFNEILAEHIVRAGLLLLNSNKFERSIKVVVDILNDWIQLFHFYPNYNTCIPSLTQKGNRLTKEEFLNSLMEVTHLQSEDENAFEKIVSLWANLIQSECNKSLVLLYIFDHVPDRNKTINETPQDANQESSQRLNIKALLVIKLLANENFESLIIKALTKRCEFSYYAYIAYQRDDDFDSEFWIVEVLNYVIDNNNLTTNYNINGELFVIINYALLFHSNQTMKLLKRLCVKYDIRNNKMGLGDESLQSLVCNFLTAIARNETKSQYNINRNKWIKEAMRWVVGCTKLRLAHTALIILNELENEKNDYDQLATHSTAILYPKEEPNSTPRSGKSTRSPSAASFQSPLKLVNGKEMSHSTATFTKERQPQNDSSSSNSSSSGSSSSSSDSNSNEEGQPNDASDDSDDKSDKEKEKYHRRSNNNIDGIEADSSDSNTPKSDDVENWKQTIQDLLKGVMKITAYFLNQDKSLPDHSTIYEFIDDTFLLFKRHFKNNEMITFEYLQSFIQSILPVEAYFENMLGLYKCCFNSEVTGEAAKNQASQFLRPFFNDLESDSEAKQSFDEFTKSLTGDNECIKDIQFVQAALKRANTEEDNKLFKNVSSSDNKTPFESVAIYNRVLGHYSIMIKTASPEMKRRIFDLSSKILAQFPKTTRSKNASNQSPKNLANKSKNQMMQSRNPTTNETGSEKSNPGHQRTPSEKQATEIILNGSQYRWKSYEYEKSEDNEPNRESTAILYQAAVDFLPGEPEALTFIMRLDEINPMISSVPFEITTWANSADGVIKQLRDYVQQSYNESVTLTDCKEIKECSNLIDNETWDCRPSILPFATQNIINSGETRQKNIFNAWMKTIQMIGGKILQKLVENKKEEENQTGSEKYNALPIPNGNDKFIPDDAIQTVSSVPIFVSFEEFLNF